MIQMDVNSKFNDPHKAHEHIVHSLEKHQEKNGRDTVVVGLGGVESLVAMMAAMDAYGPDNTLAISAYSVHSNSQTPAVISEAVRKLDGHHCTVDITRPIQETLQLHIGLRKIELEQMHFSMNQWHKAELIASLRNTICRGVAIRHDASYVEAYSLSKIKAGWVVPGVFDWNPVCDLTYQQLITVAQRRCPDDEMVKLRSGLDVWSDGGPFPDAAGIDLKGDDVSEKKLQHLNLAGNGLGMHQE